MTSIDTEYRRLCVSLPTVRDGMISQADDQFDTGQIEKFIGPRRPAAATTEGT
jgi:hypothetical protein